MKIKILTPLFFFIFFLPIFRPALCHANSLWDDMAWEDGIWADNDTTFNVYTLTNAGGSLTPANLQTMEPNTITEYTVTADFGYHIQSVNGCDGSLNQQAFTTGPITSDCTVEILFEKNSYAVTTSTGPGGLITPSSEQMVSFATTLSVTITPHTGYRIDSVSGCGGTLSDYIYATATIDDNCTIVANFAETLRPLTPTTSESWIDDMIYSNDQTISLNSSFFKSNAQGYHIGSAWRLRPAIQPYNDDDQTDNSNYYFTTPKDNEVVELNSDNLLGGMMYYWQVQHQGSIGGYSDWSEEYSFLVGSLELGPELTIFEGRRLPSYQIVSFGQWFADPSAIAVLASSLGQEYNTSSFRIGTYDALTSSYITYDNGLEIIPGQAYWFLCRDGLSLELSGVPVNTFVDIDVPLLYNSSTGNGWNMIAPPNQIDYSWASLQIVVYDQTGQIIFGPESIINLSDDNPYIDTRLWSWQGDGYDSNWSFLEKNKGYWVKTRQNNVYLRFPVLAQANLSIDRQSFAISSKRAGKSFLTNLLGPSNAIAAVDESPPMPMNDFSSEPGVVGSGEGCFIATAAYGSYLAPEVLNLRHFRDTILMISKPGQALVQAYYRYSPPLAAFISKDESLRRISRICLTPIVYVVKFPTTAALLMAFIIFGLGSYLYRKRIIIQ